ncbi:hypothetical protein [Parvularcula maris]
MVIAAGLAASAVLLLLGKDYLHASLAGSVGGRDCPAALIQEATARAARTFPNDNAEPVIRCMKGPALGLRVDYGASHFLPVLPTLILLGPKGQNTDVLAHELVHAEVRAKTGALVRSYGLPTWFDEGLGMQADERAPFQDLGDLAPSPGDFPELGEIGRPSTFFRAGRQSRLNYGFARCVVAGWLEAEGTDLDGFLKDQSLLGKFPTDRFEPHAAACRERLSQHS